MTPEILAIAERIRTQDNRMTDNPFFCVQVKRRDVGYDVEYGDGRCWHNFGSMDTVYEDDIDFKEPVGKEWAAFGYKDRWETVMIALTEKGAMDYMEANGHNVRRQAFHGKTRIYVESLFRCQEMVAVREFLITLK